MTWDRAILFALLLVVFNSIYAQTDTLASGDDLWKLRHSPKRATLYSALIPGAGQVYNRKYWKAPIAWAGLGISYYFIRENRTQYDRYKDAYIAVVDGDPNTIDEFNGAYSSGALLDVANTYRRWRDMSYVAIGLVYVLNIVDAAVDAHFVRFDVGRDLSLGIGPSVPMAAQGGFGVALTIQL